MDNGRDLTRGPPGPWLPASDQRHLEFVCLPVPQNFRGIALQKAQKQTQTWEGPGIVNGNDSNIRMEDLGSSNSPVTLPQTASLLPL